MSRVALLAAEAAVTTRASYICAVGKNMYPVFRPTAPSQSIEKAPLRVVGLHANWAPRLETVRGTPNMADLLGGDAMTSSQVARLAKRRFRRPAASPVSRYGAQRSPKLTNSGFSWCPTTFLDGLFSGAAVPASSAPISFPRRTPYLHRSRRRVAASVSGERQLLRLRLGLRVQ